MGTSNNRAKSLSREREIRTVTANTELTGNDDILFVDATAGNVVVILPLTTGVIKRHYTVKKIDSSANTVTLSRTDPDTIEGANTYVMTKEDEFVEVHAKSGDWRVIASSASTEVTVDELITTQGDIIQGGSAGTGERLAKGASGTFLKAGASTNAWAALAASDVQSGTFADARISESSVTQHEAALSVATSQLTGTLPDARVAESNVTQHEAALSIGDSQFVYATISGETGITNAEYPPGDVRRYGAVGTGTETTQIQNAIDSINAIGGGTVLFQPITYRARNLKAKNNVTLKGTFGVTQIKVPDSVDGVILYNDGRAVPTTIDYFGLDGIIFDGNVGGVAGVTASSAVSIDGLTYFRARDCIFRNATGYGLGFQAYPNFTYSGAQTNLYLENCFFIDNGVGVGGDTFDGLDIKDCHDVTMVGCYANGNSDKGINIRGEKVTIIGGACESNGGSGYEFSGNSNGEAVKTTVSLSACEARLNGGGGFAISDGFATPTQSVRVTMSSITSEGNLYGVQIPTLGTISELVVSGASIQGNTSHGVTLGANHVAAVISDSVIRDNTGSGVYTNGAKAQINACQINSNTRYGVEEGSSGTRTLIGGATALEGNSLGSILWATNKRGAVGDAVRDYSIGSGDIIASAATITLPETGKYFAVTGTTNITSVSASWRGREVFLHFTGILTFTDGSNLLLAGNFVTTSNDVIHLICDGANWLEASRSAN